MDKSSDSPQLGAAKILVTSFSGALTLRGTHEKTLALLAIHVQVVATPVTSSVQRQGHGARPASLGARSSTEERARHPNTAWGVPPVPTPSWDVLLIHVSQ